MRKSFIHILLIVVFFVAACTGATDSSVTDGGSIGTTIYKPKPPELNLFPDFDAEIPETALGSTLTAESSVGTSFLALESQFSLSELWESNFLHGGIKNAREKKTTLEEFGLAVAQALSDAGITEISAETQTVTVSQKRLVDATQNWEIDVTLEPSDSNYARYYFRDTDTGLLQATYVVAMNEAGEPQRGLFAFVNPSLMADEPADGSRVVALAFDVTDSAKKLLVLRTELYHRALNKFYTYNVQQQCDESTATCLGEYAEIFPELPTPTINTEVSTRFSWNESTGAVCLALMSYASGQPEVGTTYSFTGPESPDDGEAQEGVCTLAMPHWGANVITPEDLLTRYEDTTPPGGTAKEYYQDGTSKAGWDSLTPSLIDGWLDGSGL